MSGAKVVFGAEAILNMISDKEGEYLEKVKAAAQRDNIYIGLPLLISQNTPKIRLPGFHPKEKYCSHTIRLSQLQVKDRTVMGLFDTSIPHMDVLRL